MESSSFTFTCPLPIHAHRDHCPPDVVTQPLFMSFSLKPTTAPGSRAAAQACYRQRNQESERAKARQRMQALCRDQKQNQAEALRQQLSSERLRSSELFQRYKVHVQHHFGTLSGQESDPQFMAGWERFRFTSGAFDRQDALFVLHYGIPAVLAPTPDEVERCLAQLNGYTMTLDLDWENAEDVEAYDRITLSNLSALGDDDFEFMFRHTLPAPTMENRV
ncbi:hypothetical protein K438DRAFT_1996546 [Mycena galopus ATCC 62051]|nr:hypothetical protein K438DRAFT_1996546 [Mycena galopus ATCC 62051]